MFNPGNFNNVSVLCCGACGQPLDGLTLAAHTRILCNAGVVKSLEQRVEELEERLMTLEKRVSHLQIEEKGSRES
jgi:uncharacterized protein YceH (UPF0502 family)